MSKSAFKSWLVSTLRPIASEHYIFAITIILLSLVSLNISLAGTIESIEFPESCHPLSVTFSGLNKSAGPPYEFVGQNRKADIVCAGKNVNIDSPIYTNGGDIIIYADQLHINAPIDTRVYFDAVKFVQSKPFAPSGAYPDGILLSSYEALTRPTQYNPNLLRSYYEYYMACVECRSVIDADGTKKSVLIPELPAGITPAYDYGPGGTFEELVKLMKPGEAPPDSAFDFDALRSGNIYLFVSDLQIAANLQNPRPPNDFLNCSVPPVTFAPYAIEAGGIRGGRGGAGTPSNCTYDNGPFNCAARILETSGLTGPGGRGGNAGSVIVEIVSDAVKPQQEALLKKVSNVSGGKPGIDLKRRGPSAAGPNAGTGKSCDFAKKEGNWPSAKPGKSGDFIIKPVSQTTALQDLARIIRPKDARPDWDLSELADRAQRSTTVTGITFDDYIMDKIAGSLALAQARVANDLDLLLISRDVSQVSYTDAPFRDINISELERSMLSTRALLFLRELSTFDVPVNSNENPLKNYLIKSGGLLNVYTSNPYGRFVSEATRLDISTANDTLRSIRGDLAGIGLQVAEVHLGPERRFLEASILKLKDALAAAEARARAESQEPWIVKTLDSLVTTVQSAGKLYANYAASNYEGVGKGIPDLAKRFQALGDLLFGYREELSTVPELMAALDQAQDEYKRFIENAALLKEEFLEQRHRAFLLALEAKTSFFSKLQSRLSQFHDLARMAVITNLMDPSKDKSVLRNNLESVKTFVHNFPVKEPYFRFRDQELDCQEEPSIFQRIFTTTNCVRISATDKKWTVVFSRYYLKDGSDFLLPLYVLAPSEQSFLLNKFGLEFLTEEYNLSIRPQMARTRAMSLR